MTRSRKFKLVHDLFALAGGEVLSKLVGFTAFALLARRLSLEAYGSVEYAVGLTAVFASVVEWGLGPVAVRELAAAPRQAATLAANISFARFCIACIAIPLMGLSSAVTGQTTETVRLVWIFSLGLLAIPWKYDWLLQGFEFMKAAAAAQLVRMTVFAVGVALFVRTSGDLLSVGAAELVAAGIGVVYYLLLQQVWVAPIHFGFSGSGIRRLLHDGFFIGVSNMLWAVIQFAPIYLVSSLFGGTQAAWFGASQRIVMSLVMFSQIYHFNLYPSLVRGGGGVTADFTTLVGASFRVLAWSGIWLALTLTLAARPLMALVYGVGFAPAAPTFSVLAWVVPVTLLSGQARWALIATGHHRPVLAAQIAGAAAVVAAGTLLIPALESLGAAITALSVALVIWIVMHRSAVARLGRLPIVYAAARPAVLALVFGALAFFSRATPITAAAVTAVAFALCAPLIDRKLPGDLKRLMHAKADLPALSKGGA